MALQPVTLDAADAGSEIVSADGAGLGATIGAITVVLWCCLHDGEVKLTQLTDDLGRSGWDLHINAVTGISTWAVPIDATTTGFVSDIATIVAAAPDLTCIMLSLDTVGATFTAYVNDTIADDFGSAFFNTGAFENADLQWHLACGNSGTNGVADLWIDPQYIDFSIEANRRKFINADLTPVDVGADGSIPTGTAPVVFLHVAGAPATIADNSGGGSAWSIINGPLTFDTACASAPPDPNFPLTGVVKVLLPPAELQFCDANGLPFAGGTLEFYQQNSTTPKDTWNSPLGGDDHLNGNPLTLDSAGRALIYGDGAYRTVLRDSAGNLIWDQPSFTYVSACMVPVVGAATLADARQAMGITDAIEAEAEARAAADSAEQTARIAADVALGARIDAEIARAEAAEAALGARIDGLPAPAPAGNTVGGEARLDSSGHYRVTFATPFAAACDSFVVTGAAVGVWSGAFNIANQDRFGCDVWGSIFGSRTPASGVSFFWLAIGH